MHGGGREDRGIGGVIIIELIIFVLIYLGLVILLYLIRVYD